MSHESLKLTFIGVTFIWGDGVENELYIKPVAPIVIMRPLGILTENAAGVPTANLFPSAEDASVDADKVVS
jgi:hypothetical protein